MIEKRGVARARLTLSKQRHESPSPPPPLFLCLFLDQIHMHTRSKNLEHRVNFWDKMVSSFGRETFNFHVFPQAIREIELIPLKFKLRVRALSI